MMKGEKRLEQLDRAFDELEHNFALGKVSEHDFIVQSKELIRQIDQILYNDSERELKEIEASLRFLEKDRDWFLKNGLVLMAEGGKDMELFVDNTLKSHDKHISAYKKLRTKVLNNMRRFSKNL